ncbi:YkgJ family cysteine cluster protein [Azomonas macrocytogenes]|uniref:YkgJ family cysteine cluster protein n=1 Tax=Azomonas macrocytogenes TaxID=69962 RepID=UPI001FEB965F|nr:YkgJ family cysteine cluster protein [Azomonas macrocytogenes]
MECRPACGACCVAPSITQPFFGMPHGKPAGIPCLHLTEHFMCNLFDKPERPAVCQRFKADPEVCGCSREEAIELITWWEQTTS